MDDDIEAIIKAAKGMSEPSDRKPFLNPRSALPSSKSNLKLAIKERIRLLCAAYVSLASFVPDEQIDELTGSQKQKVTVKRVLKEMERNRREIESFKPLDLPKGRRHQ